MDKIKAGSEQKKKISTDMKIFLSAASVIAIGLIIVLIVILSPKDEPVAKFNGEEIKKSEFDYYYTQGLTAVLQYKDPAMDEQTYLSTPYNESGATLKDMVKQQALTQVVQVKYLLSEAEKEGYVFDTADINAKWESFRSGIEQNAQYYQMDTEEFSKTYIGSGLRNIEQIYRDQAMSAVYFYAKADLVEVDDGLLHTYYEENKADIDIAVVRHILVNCTEDSSEDVVEEKKKLAENILKKVNDGDDFSALVQEYSEDTGSKSSGGLYQIHRNGQYVIEFENWAFTHKVGETGIIKTQFGFHVMKLDALYDTLESQMEKITGNYQVATYQMTMEENLETNFTLDLLDAFKNF